MTYLGRLRISLLGRLLDRCVLGGMVVASPRLKWDAPMGHLSGLGGVQLFVILLVAVKGIRVDAQKLE